MNIGNVVAKSLSAMVFATAGWACHGVPTTHPRVAMDAGDSSIDAGPGEDGGIADGGFVGCVGSALRVEVPCAGDGSHAWNCTVGPTHITPVATANFPGDTTRKYMATLRVRGVFEERAAYKEGAHGPGDWYVGGTLDTSDSLASGWNLFRLRVLDDDRAFFLNAAAYPASDAWMYPYVVAQDYVVSVELPGGATLELMADTVDDGELRNAGPDHATPLVVPGVSPAPASFDGQFIQVDCLSFTEKI